ncbi:hypothetical protein VTN96DRAFT_512 [Rasamsonia emersonii]
MNAGQPLVLVLQSKKGISWSKMTLSTLDHKRKSEAALFIAKTGEWDDWSRGAALDADGRPVTRGSCEKTHAGAGGCQRGCNCSQGSQTAARASQTDLEVRWRISIQERSRRPHCHQRQLLIRRAAVDGDLFECCHQQAAVHARSQPARSPVAVLRNRRWPLH